VKFGAWYDFHARGLWRPYEQLRCTALGHDEIEYEAHRAPSGPGVNGDLSGLESRIDAPPVAEKLFSDSKHTGKPMSQSTAPRAATGRWPA
jgi:hypothetical protein